MSDLYEQSTTKIPRYQNASFDFKELLLVLGEKSM